MGCAFGINVEDVRRDGKEEKRGVEGRNIRIEKQGKCTYIPMNTNMTTTRSLRTDDQNSSSAKPRVPKRERMTRWSEG